MLCETCVTFCLCAICVVVFMAVSVVIAGSNGAAGIDERGAFLPPGFEGPDPRELEHFALINELRASGFTCPGGERFPANREGLKFDCRLWKAAQLHAQDMASQDYFDHESRDGRSFADRARAFGASASAENLQAGSASAESALSALGGSDGHCRNMMDPAARQFAAGYAAGRDSKLLHYWVQLFSRDDGPADESCLAAVRGRPGRGSAAPGAPARSDTFLRSV
mmetsp:Transcript_51077/g.143799  ORF Transcript_51077/g.143799 Transcript_51077/m.143799 type:complete len:224 (+) Transcript_51077:82-753(+)